MVFKTSGSLQLEALSHTALAATNIFCLASKASSGHDYSALGGTTLAEFNWCDTCQVSPNTNDSHSWVGGLTFSMCCTTRCSSKGWRRAFRPPSYAIFTSRNSCGRSCFSPFCGLQVSPVRQDTPLAVSASKKSTGGKPEAPPPLLQHPCGTHQAAELFE